MRDYKDVFRRREDTPSGAAAYPPAAAAFTVRAE